MRFEQAFYTRGSDLLNEKGTGLGIAAASRTDYKFLQDCMSVGGKFNTERSKEKAEFLIYSDRLESFVGVGVSPAFNEDGGNVNKLCHIYVPAEPSENPGDCFVSYDFQSKVEKGELLNVVEKSSYLDTGNFSMYLNKYGIDEEKLAYFLYKLYPVALKERNLLLVVLEEGTPEEKIMETAREVAWMFHCLVPAVGKDAILYRKNLSYAANSRDNISIVNLAFTTDESLFANHKIYLNAVEEIEVPEVYRALAKKALSSYKEFEQMLVSFQESCVGLPMSCLNLEVMYLQWKAEQKISIDRTTLPVSMEYIVEEANKRKAYRKLLYTLIPALDHLTGADTELIWNYVMGLVILADLQDEIDVNCFEAAMLKVLRTMYKEEHSYYLLVLENMKQEVKRRYMEFLYNEEPSIVKNHIKDIETAAECEELFKLYDGLHENTEFLGEMTEIAEKHYDAMSLNQREYFGEVLRNFDQLSWKEKVKAYIFRIFENENALELLEAEIDKIELEHLSDYYELIIRKISVSEDSRWAHLGSSFYSKYGDSLSWNEKQSYHEVLPRIEMLKTKERLKELGLHALAEEKMEQFPMQYASILKAYWCECVIGRLMEPEKGEWLESLKQLLLKYDNLSEFFETEGQRELKKSFEEAIWKACDGDFAKKMRCSLRFGIHKFSVWECVKDVNDFEKIYDRISKISPKELPGKERIVETEVENHPVAEFRRKSYLIWRKMVHASELILDVWGNASLEDFTIDALGYIKGIQMHLVEKYECCAYQKERSKLCMNYIILEIKREELLGTAFATYENLTAIRQMGFFDNILNAENAVRGETQTKRGNAKAEQLVQKVFDYIQRMKCYEKIQRYNQSGFKTDKAKGTLAEAKGYFGSEVHDIRVLEERIGMMLELEKSEKRIDDWNLEIKEIQKKIQQEKERKRQLEEQLNITEDYVEPVVENSVNEQEEVIWEGDFVDVTEPLIEEPQKVLKAEVEKKAEAPKIMDNHKKKTLSIGRETRSGKDLAQSSKNDEYFAKY